MIYNDGRRHNIFTPYFDAKGLIGMCKIKCLEELKLKKLKSLFEVFKITLVFVIAIKLNIWLNLLNFKRHF